MKQLASKERSEKVAAQNRCAYLERALYSAQTAQTNLIPNAQFIAPRAQFAPTQSQFIPVQYGSSPAAAVVERISIESIETPEYLA